MSQTSFGRAVKSASRHPLWIVLGIALLSAGVGAYTLIGNRRPAEPELRGAVLINADRWGTDEAVLVARVAKNAALRSDAGAPPLDAAASAPAVATDAGGPVSTERTKPPRPAAEPAGDKTPARPRSPTAPSLDAAAEEARALASYSRGDHKAAIEILRATASGSPANAAALTRRAQLIADINEKMAVGTAANTSPDEAVAALRSAIETDSRELEGRARTVLARQASPALARIAASHMANRRYPKAYETTVAARELGATGDDGIDRVSAALERKARALYKKAHASRGKKRRQYAQEVLKIVSPKSLWFKRARRLLPRS